MSWEKVDENTAICVKFREEKFSEDEIKRIRNKYKPKKVRILFIGESPPKTTFFYCKNSNLYKATKKAFEKAYGRQIRNFLECFMNLGCYLIDFFDMPNKKLNDACQTFKDKMTKLIQEIKRLNPDYIIVVHERVCYCVCLALLKAGMKIEIRCLPFPRDKNHRNAYINQLAELIKKELIPNKILPQALTIV